MSSVISRTRIGFHHPSPAARSNPARSGPSGPSPGDLPDTCQSPAGCHHPLSSRRSAARPSQPGYRTKGWPVSCPLQATESPMIRSSAASGSMCLSRSSRPKMVSVIKQPPKYWWHGSARRREGVQDLFPNPRAVPYDARWRGIAGLGQVGRRREEPGQGPQGGWARLGTAGDGRAGRVG